MRKNPSVGKRGNFEIDKKKIGIKWKLYSIIVIFIAAALICIWFFQIRMLNYFYQNIRFSELDSSYSMLEEAIEEKRLSSRLTETIAEDYSLSVWVLRVEEINGIKKASFLTSSNEPQQVPFFAEKIEALYSKAINNDGKYVAIMSIEDFEKSTSSLVIVDESEGNRNPLVLRGDVGDLCALQTQIMESDGNEYVIVQLASMTPLESVVDTLRYQFVCIGIVMGIMAVALTTLLSNLITKPFVKMNEAAKSLAEGKYDIDFSGKGYREINELADTLNYASVELAKTDKFQKELISNISHDLKTPLTMIKGYSEMMRDIPEENTPENVQVVIDETARLSELVNDMLDLSKIKSGTRTPELAEFSLTQTVKDTLSRYEKLAMQDGYKISFEFEEDIDIVADRGMILQVVYNLVNNAINYSGEDKTVIVRQTRGERTVKISVVDSGAGIEPDELPLIWDRYYKVDKVHRRATVGTGLGLSIVKEILSLHNAYYGVESAVGEGSTFWFEMEISPLSRSVIDVIDAEYDNEDESKI